jgi:hypothetical protein
MTARFVVVAPFETRRLVLEEYVSERVVPVALVKVVVWSAVTPETVSAPVVSAPVSPRVVPVAERKFKFPFNVRKVPEMPWREEVAPTLKVLFTRMSLVVAPLPKVSAVPEAEPVKARLVVVAEPPILTSLFTRRYEVVAPCETTRLVVDAVPVAVKFEDVAFPEKYTSPFTSRRASVLVESAPIKTWFVVVVRRTSPWVRMDCHGTVEVAFVLVAQPKTPLAKVYVTP